VVQPTGGRSNIISLLSVIFVLTCHSLTIISFFDKPREFPSHEVVFELKRTLHQRIFQRSMQVSNERAS